MIIFKDQKLQEPTVFKNIYIKIIVNFINIIIIIMSCW